MFKYKKEKKILKKNKINKRKYNDITTIDG